MRALRSAYRAAGWKPTTPGDAPFAWILETSPIFETDTLPLILEAKQVFTHLLGNPVQPDAAMAGPSAYRKTMLFSNMGREDQFDSIQGWTPVPMIRSLQACLPPNYKPPTVESWHITPRYLHNTLGSPVKMSPKYMRSKDSYAFKRHRHGRADTAWE
eukprot:jgi/Tetstr1/460702/TSEL_005889.t1